MTGAPSMELIQQEIQKVSQELCILARWMTQKLSKFLTYFYSFTQLICTSCIFQAHPGTIVYNTDRYSGWSSLENAWHQVEVLGNDLMEISRRHPEGIHLLGYSQGGLLARVMLEVFGDHNVKNFISLSSPQAGQFGSEFNKSKSTFITLHRIILTTC